MKKTMVRFIDCYVPTEVCNLKCSYCYIGQRSGFGGAIHTIQHTPEEVRAALGKKRFGGSVFINFCAGGETLLGKGLLPIVRALIDEGHFVQIVTNGTIREPFEEIAHWEKELLDNLFVKFSFHYIELKRLGKLDDFFEHILMLKSAGCSISLEITPGDEMIPYIDEMKKISSDKLGALPHVTVARNSNTGDYRILTELNREEYINTWKSFESPMFDLKMRLLNEKRNEYCYGGEWTFYLNLNTGDLRQCYRGDIIDNIYEDVNVPINFKPIGTGCREKYCWNGHAWMTLGCIPNMDIISYADIRNRLANDGTEWLTPSAKEFMSQKLEEHNIDYENVSSTPKVLLLGDSICEGYRETVKNNLGKDITVYWPQDIVKFSSYFLRYIHEWARHMHIGSNIDVVHFNVGLWDILRIDGDEPLVDIGTYGKNLQRIIERLRYVFPNAKIVFATTTPVREEDAEYDFLRLNTDVEQYNQCAIKIMEENHITINDLHKTALERLGGLYSDFTHFTSEGYDILATSVSDAVKRALQMPKERFMAFKMFLKDSEVRENIDLLRSRKVRVYGAGNYGKKITDFLHKKGIAIQCIYDTNAELQGKEYRGIQIISPKSYLNEGGIYEEDILIIAIESRSIVKDIVETFRKCNGLWICSLDAFLDLDR